jgi:plasmid stabilization system protein ParE
MGQQDRRQYMNGIAAALDRFEVNPDILRLEPEIAPNLFFYRFKKHFLVCDVAASTVTVLAVIHTSMDLAARLLELEPRLGVEAEILKEKLRRKN